MTVTRYPVEIEGETALIGTAGELVAALDVLQGQHDRAVLEQLTPHLADILSGPKGLYATLKILEPEDQLYLIQALGPQLGNVIQTASALRDILATLAESGVPSWARPRNSPAFSSGSTARPTGWSWSCLGSRSCDVSCRTATISAPCCALWTPRASSG